MVQDYPVFIRQEGRRLRVTSHCPRELVRRYFAMDHQEEKILATLPRDEFLSPAIDYCHGLRIMRQPDWECLASFITSSMKQVKHIQQINHALRRNYGQKVSLCDQDFYTFPSAQALARVEEKELRETCRLGWRAPTLLQTAEMVTSRKFRMGRYRRLAYDQAHSELCNLPGIGPKVANCVLLFAFEKLEAFPIDVWIERALRECYFRDARKKPTAGELREFAKNYFGPYGGYAQQYLFHYWRNHRGKKQARAETLPLAQKEKQA
jgi:N-glycosylase/DNA lyase